MLRLLCVLATAALAHAASDDSGGGCPCPGHPGRTWCPLDPALHQCESTANKSCKPGGSCKGKSSPSPPSYPIPSSCNFVDVSATGGRIINKAYGHYFCRPQGMSSKRLFVFLPGTGTNDYMSVVKTAASVGMHAVSLDWDNHPCAAAACTEHMKPPVTLTASIANCTLNLQLSRLIGTALVDGAVTTVANESIVGRTVMLLDYLSRQEPAAADCAPPMAVPSLSRPPSNVTALPHTSFNAERGF
jgi:hypothetical protein